DFMLDAEIVLVGVRRAQVRIDEENAGTSECPDVVYETDVVIHRFRRKWIGGPKGTEGITQKCIVRGCGSRKITLGIKKIGGRSEWELPVELEVVLGLEDIVEKTRSSTNAGFSILERLPGEPKARSKIVTCREVGRAGRSLIAGEN